MQIEGSISGGRSCVCHALVHRESTSSRSPTAWSGSAAFGVAVARPLRGDGSGRSGLRFAQPDGRDKLLDRGRAAGVTIRARSPVGAR